MYLLKNELLKNNNIAVKLAERPSIDISIHWLNPLLHKCKKKLYPDRITIKAFIKEWLSPIQRI